MFFAACKSTAYLHDEHSAVLLSDKPFTFLSGLIRVHILELLRCYEENLLIYLTAELRIAKRHLALGIHDSLDDRPYGFLQEFHIPLIARDHLFPVPLIYKN